MRAKFLFLSLASFFAYNSFSQNALNFDGVDDRVNCGNNTSIQLSGSAISLEAWIYPTAWTAQVWQGNIINKENNAPDYGYMLRCGDNGKLNFNIGNGSWHELTTAANTLSLNSWQHVAGTYDGSMIRLYVNGQLVDSTSLSVNFSSGLKNLTIGNWSNSPDRAYAGSIDEVRVWNVVRNRAEILANMNKEFCTAPLGLVAYYQLNEGLAGANNSGINSANDLSAFSNNGTLSNFTLNGSSSNWLNGSGISPASDFVQITDSTCDNYLGPGGVLYDSSGVYIDTLLNSDGCDSIIETTLTVNSVSNGVTANSNILVAQQAGASYQWLDCNAGMQALSNANAQLLSPPDPMGSYAVIINYRGCIDTSSCYSLSGLSTFELPEPEIALYPNPNNGIFYLKHSGLNLQKIQLLDYRGQLLKEFKEIGGSQTQIETLDFPKGVYILLVHGDDKVDRLRFIKN